MMEVGAINISEIPDLEVSVGVNDAGSKNRTLDAISILDAIFVVIFIA